MGVNRDRVSAYRKLHNFTQAHMAKGLKISKQSYHLKESGKNDYTDEQVGIMAKMFGVEPGDLYKGSESPLC